MADFVLDRVQPGDAKDDVVDDDTGERVPVGIGAAEGLENRAAATKPEDGPGVDVSNEEHVDDQAVVRVVDRVPGGV